jgi:ribosomal protein S18 acetylase RimI-like enzyme
MGPPSTPLVRPATRDDYQAVAALNREVQQLHADAHPHIFKAPAAGDFTTAVFEGMVGQTGGHLLVLEDAGTVTGYVFAYEAGRPETWSSFARRHLYLDQICVAASHRGRGHGQRLMNAVLELARARGLDQITLDTWWFNTSARAFFARLGFREQMVRFARNDAGSEPARSCQA